MADDRDRRSIERINVPGAVAAYTKEINLKFFTRFSKPFPVINFSKTGVCLSVKNSIKKGDRIIINIMIPGERNLQLIGEVLWRSMWEEADHYAVGIQFTAFGRGKYLNSMQSLERLRNISKKFAT